MNSVMYLKEERISPGLLCRIVPSLTIEQLKECIENSEKYKDIKDYQYLSIEMKSTLYGEILKNEVIKDQKYIRRNYHEWFDENYGIHYTCAFVIARYFCKKNKTGLFENEIRQLKKNLKNFKIFYKFLREQKVRGISELLSKEVCIDSERLEVIIQALIN